MKKFLLSLATAFSFVLFLGSVSYTHLDVYKRQVVVIFVSKNGCYRHGDVHPTVRRLNLVHMVFDFNTFQPVSYTHLPSVEESAGMTDADWAKLGNDFMQRMGLMNHQYIIVTVSYTHLQGTPINI